MLTNIKKIFLTMTIIICGVSCFFVGGVLAQDLIKADLNIYFFYGDGCPHCLLEEKFLHEQLKIKYPQVRIWEFEVYKNRQNALLLQQVSKILNVNVSGVPFTVVGDKPFVGYAESLTSQIIISQVEQCLTVGCPDSLYELLATDQSEQTPAESIDKSQSKIDEKILPSQEFDPDFSQSEIEKTKGQVMDQQEKIQIPVLGEINVKDFSLPVLTIILGLLDGFNPCAMWALIFLITLLFGLKDKKKMWILGTAFIVTSAFVYFLFMVAWLNLIIFVGFIFWVRILIGLVAILGGVYSLKYFFINKEATCEVTGTQKRQKVFEKLRQVISQKCFILSLVGIIGLAFVVNLVELICSAGFPAIYTQVLALSNLSTSQYFGYILLYILFFMIDDLFVFFVAMITLQVTGISTKYVRYAKLIGGLLMVIIGLLLIFKPELLMFG